jgi:1-acyl-sn-glycerol-3-phosphate acyltransferase
MRWMGGIPVDRSSPHGVVAESIAGFSRSSRRILVIAPEGTRKRVPRFKSGFLHIARGAGVPVTLASLDFGARCIRLGPTFDVPEDIDAEVRRLEAFFSGVRGKNPRAM